MKSDSIIIIPTYNEKENIENIIPGKNYNKFPRLLSDMKLL